MFRRYHVVYTLLILILSLVFVFVGCQKAQKPEGGSQEQQQKKMPEEIEKIEMSVLEIMTQADLIPVVEKVSQQKKAQEGGQGGGGGSQGESGEGGQGGGGGSQGQGQQGGGKQQEMVTFEETILSELLKKEKSKKEGGNQEEAGDQKPPEETSQVWDQIKMTVMQLHDQWNGLEPVLIQEQVPQEVISGFEEELDNLTSFIINQDFYNTLFTANQLTQYLPEFMKPFAQDSSPAAFELKYHLRKVVLTAAIKDYLSAQESLDKIKERDDMVLVELQKDAKSTAQEYNTSINNLQRTVDKKDIDLVKINAAMVMENIMQIIEDLTTAKMQS